MNAQVENSRVTFENPMGIDGFEFVEYAAPPGQAQALRDYFRKLGFVQVARHKTRPISTWRQGDCTFLINEDPDSFAARFAAEHGPSACGFAIRVNKLAEWAREHDYRLVAIDNPPHSTRLEETQLPERCLLVFGQESTGISQELQDVCQDAVRIEQYGSTRSMNVAAAAAIAMHWWVSQHRRPQHVK